MPRYLVVANQTLGGEQLMDEIRRASARPNSFFILVPATAPVDTRAGDRAQILFSEGLARPQDVQAREEAAEHRALVRSQSRLEQLVRRIRAEP